MSRTLAAVTAGNIAVALLALPLATGMAASGSALALVAAAISAVNGGWAAFNILDR